MKKKHTTATTGGFVRYFRCIDSLMDRGILDGTDVAIYQRLAAWANYESGVAAGVSPRRLEKCFGRSTNLRAMRDKLAKLKRLGLISYNASSRTGEDFSVFVVGYPIPSKDTFIMSNPLESETYETMTEDEFSTFSWLKPARVTSGSPSGDLRVTSGSPSGDLGTPQAHKESTSSEVFEIEDRMTSGSPSGDLRATFGRHPGDPAPFLYKEEEVRSKNDITPDPKNEKPKNKNKSAFKAPLSSDEDSGEGEDSRDEEADHPEDENDKGKHSPALGNRGPWANRLARASTKKTFSASAPQWPQPRPEPVPETTPTPVTVGAEDSDSEVDPLSAEALVRIFTQKFPFRQKLGSVPHGVQVNSMRKLMERVPAEELVTLFEWLFVHQINNLGWQNKMRSCQKPVDVFLAVLDDSHGTSSGDAIMPRITDPIEREHTIVTQYSKPGK